MKKKLRSMNPDCLSWKEAILQSAGPRTVKEGLLLFAKGLGMGSADIVPGVSGGTIALITGIYEQLLRAIQSVNMEAVTLLLKGDFKKALSVIHSRFLFILLAGIGAAVVSLARLMHYFLQAHPVPTWGFFLGLVFASILIMGKTIQHWQKEGGAFFLIGALGAFFMVGMIPVSTPEAAWFIFLSGMIAICAMILPGISGSFLLLILGKYQYVTGAIKNPFLLENVLIILVFCGGCLVGILSFSRVLNFMLSRFHNITMSLLTGLMFGSLRKVWPWKETLETISIRGKVHVLQARNILPPEYSGEFFLTGGLIMAGFIMVLFLSRLAKEK